VRAAASPLHAHPPTRTHPTNPCPRPLCRPRPQLTHLARTHLHPRPRAPTPARPPTRARAPHLAWTRHPLPLPDQVWVLSELLERSALLATLEDAANAAADGEDDEAVDVEAAAAAAAEAEAAAEEVAGVGDARAWAGDARAAAFKLPEGMDAESWDKAQPWTA